MRQKALIVLIALCFVSVVAISQTLAVTAENIDKGVERSIKMFEDIKGGPEVIKKAKGMLVFPAVFKGGIGIGGEYGEGALLIGGKTSGYYSTAAASIGFQLGGQKKTIIIAFMDQAPLDQFLKSKGWKIGADASVAVITLGADGSIDTSKTNKPIVAFALDKKGLMYNLTLEGAKVTKIER